MVILVLNRGDCVLNKQQRRSCDKCQRLFLRGNVFHPVLDCFHRYSSSLHVPF